MWLDVLKWTDQLYWVAHHSTWYTPEISAHHVNMLYYN
jgi:hypothetical protein